MVKPILTEFNVLTLNLKISFCTKPPTFLQSHVVNQVLVFCI